MRGTRENTETEFLSAKKSFCDTLGQFNSSNMIMDAENLLDRIEEMLNDFQQNGAFKPEDDERRVYRHSGHAAIVEEEAREKHGSYVAGARRAIAVGGLNLLQKQIPALQELAKRCLEVAGKDAVRTACAPITIEGKSIPGSFTLPPGFESGVAGVVSKVKSALSK